MKTVLILFIIFTSQVSNAFLPKQFKVSFVQEFKSTITGKIKKGEGIIDYQYPGKIRFKSEEPDPLIYVSNNKKSWYYTPPFIEGEKGEVTIIHKSSTLTSFFDSLKNGLKSNSLYQVKQKSKKFDLIFSADKSKELGVQSATLVSNSTKLKDFKQIKEIDLLYNTGKKVTLKFKRFSNITFHRNHFNFKIPPNTRVAN